MKKVNKTPKQLERHFKGVANHHRIEIILLLARKDGVDLGEIAKILSCNIENVSEHTQKLVQAGLVNKT